MRYDPVKVKTYLEYVKRQKGVPINHTMLAQKFGMIVTLATTVGSIEALVDVEYPPTVTALEWNVHKAFVPQ